MNWKLINGYVLAVLALLILALAAILLLNNLGGNWPMQFFWRPATLRPAVGMLLSGAGGLIVWWTISRLLPTAIRALRAGRREKPKRRE